MPGSAKIGYRLYADGPGGFNVVFVDVVELPWQRLYLLADGDLDAAGSRMPWQSEFPL